MPRRRTAFALAFVLAIGPAIASEEGEAAQRDIERMTPAQLRAASTEQARLTEQARRENEALRRRLEQLERRIAASAAKRAELAAAVEELRARLTDARGDRAD